jgi:hypothetical protein
VEEVDVQQSPIVIKLIEPHEKGLDEVLIGALGLTGIIVLAAVVLGVALAGLMFWLRSRSA